MTPIYGSVIQRIVEKPHFSTNALMIVLDGSIKTQAHLDQILAALQTIPEGRMVGLAIASEEEVLLAPAKWSVSRQQQIQETLKNTEFVGGQNNAPAIANAIRQLETFNNAELLWIHTPQPINFKNGNALLDQTIDRISHMPQLTLYSLLPGPNKLFDDGKAAAWSRSLAKIDSVEIDLKRYFDEVFSDKPRFVVERISAHSTENLRPGSQHLSRLWARDQIFRMLRQHAAQDDMIELAASYQLVTPVSGAVVLENQQQYDRNDLTPVKANTVPTIPEPHQWILAIILMALTLWYLKKHPQLIQGIVHAS